MAGSPIWIAGLGAVSAAGFDVPATLASFQSGQRNPATDLPFTSSIACPTFLVKADLPVLRGQFNNSRSLRLAMKAVAEAMNDAGIDSFPSDIRVGVSIGTTVASQLNCIPFYEAYRGDGNPPLEPVYDYLHANLAQAVGELLGVHGPRMTVVNACSSGADAIGIASQWIQAGLCDLAIAGGADELNRVALAGFWSLGVMSTEPCAPFDRDRTGLNLGEGAGMVVLESAEHAKKRGNAHAFELAGYGAACDAHHLTSPHPEARGLNLAIKNALAQGQVDPSSVAFINAHGTATTDNDRAEGKAIGSLFRTDIPFLSTKGYTGHTLGAAGGLEAVFTVLGLRERWIPRSAGFENADSEIAVVPVRQRTQIAGEYAISTSLAFGGNNAALLIRRSA